jgi:hypothetical protein
MRPVCRASHDTPHHRNGMSAPATALTSSGEIRLRLVPGSTPASSGSTMAGGQYGGEAWAAARRR